MVFVQIKKRHRGRISKIEILHNNTSDRLTEVKKYASSIWSKFAKPSANERDVYVSGGVFPSFIVLL